MYIQCTHVHTVHAHMYIQCTCAHIPLLHLPMITNRLCRFCHAGSAEEVEKLLADGANPNFSREDASRRQPLHCAVEAGHVQVAQLLLQFGASVDGTEAHGFTPLMLAVVSEKRHVDETVPLLDLLVRNGADVNATDHSSNTALHLAAASSSSNSLSFLLALPHVEASPIGWGYLAPLHYAGEAGDVAAATAIVAARADPGCIDACGWTCLHWAARRGHAQMCWWLVNDVKLDVNVKDFVSFSSVCLVWGYNGDLFLSALAYGNRCSCN
eukprot:GHVS01037788.1.p1 GENE.GHVS01037788.1~~GHVS01037788.1.p1  ORF type:complete len:269 (-),score=42.16 GHVS01037788.1:1006-1812(-)